MVFSLESGVVSLKIKSKIDHRISNSANLNENICDWSYSVSELRSVLDNLPRLGLNVNSPVRRRSIKCGVGKVCHIQSAVGATTYRFFLWEWQRHEVELCLFTLSFHLFFSVSFTKQVAHQYYLTDLLVNSIIRFQHIRYLFSVLVLIRQEAI